MEQCFYGNYVMCSKSTYNIVIHNFYNHILFLITKENSTILIRFVWHTQKPCIRQSLRTGSHLDMCRLIKSHALQTVTIFNIRCNFSNSHTHFNNSETPLYTQYVNSQHTAEQTPSRTECVIFTKTAHNHLVFKVSKWGTL